VGQDGNHRHNQTNQQVVYFRTDRPSYQAMLDAANRQVDMFDTSEDISCFCGD